MIFRSLLRALVLLCVLRGSVVTAAVSESRPSFPAGLARTSVPAGHDEAGLDSRRSEWLEQIHRSAPGTDWRAIESANRLETMLLRQSAPLAANSAAWLERGAPNITGRTFGCALASDGQLYVGSANGGLFRGPETGGTDWAPLMDNVGYGTRRAAAAAGGGEQHAAVRVAGRGCHLVRAAGTARLHLERRACGA
jgi:hypothetical protein